MDHTDPLPEPLRSIKEHFGLPAENSIDHGPKHWKSVALVGLQLARRDHRIDLFNVFVFAQLHDSQRLSEFEDPEHGQRAAQIFAAEMERQRIDGYEAGDARGSKLIHALKFHDSGKTALNDPTIGACWDADRLNLGRIGIVPSYEYMSTDAALSGFDDLVSYAKILDSMKEVSWGDVIRAITTMQP